MPAAADETLEYAVVALLAIVVGFIIVLCLLACVLPDELSEMMGGEKKVKEQPKASSGKADAKSE
jgi:hypothetical protein